MSIVAANYGNLLTEIPVEKSPCQEKASYANLPTDIHSVICDFAGTGGSVRLRATNRSNRVLTTRYLKNYCQDYLRKNPDDHIHPISTEIKFLNAPFRLKLLESYIMQNASIFLSLNQINKTSLLTKNSYDVRLIFFDGLKVLVEAESQGLTPGFYAIQPNEAEDLMCGTTSLLLNAAGVQRASSFEQKFEKLKTKIQKVVRTDIDGSL